MSAIAVVRHRCKSIMSRNPRQYVARKIAFNFVVAMLWCCCSALFSLAFTFDSSTTPEFQPNAQTRDLVRKVVANELKQEELDKSHYMFKLKKVTPKGTRVQQIVQTDQGSIARTILLNGQPPTDDVRQAEEQKIQKLIGDQ